MTRRHGEVALALLQAVAATATPESAPTERELAAAARVGLQATRNALANLVRSGALMIVRRRQVPYSSKPVAEYAPPVPVVLPFAGLSVLVDLMPSWVAMSLVDRQYVPGSAAESEAD